MKNEKEFDSHCPLCHNNCSLNNLKCGKGRAFAEKINVSQASENNTDSIELKSNNIETKLMHLFKVCTHILHHRKGHHQLGQSRILAILLKKGAITQRELLDFTETRSSSMSELLGKMETTGYISREKCIDDKRNITVSLTESGMMAAKDLEKNREQSTKELFSSLDDNEKNQLENILTKLISSWKEDDSRGNDDKFHHKHCHHHGCHMHGHAHGKDRQ